MSTLVIHSCAIFDGYKHPIPNYLPCEHFLSNQSGLTVLVRGYLTGR